MSLDKRKNYTVMMDGREMPVFNTAVGDYVILCFKGEKTLTISMEKTFESVAVRPTSHSRTMEIMGNTLSLQITDRERLSVEPYGLENPLFVLCAQRIDKPTEATHVFLEGTVTEIGTLELLSNDCVYIEEGAVVIGSFIAQHKNNITITGNGILLGTPLHSKIGEKRKRDCMMRFLCCEDVTISGVTVVDGPTWHIVPIACKHVVIKGINIITIVMSGDGIDVVGCEDVEITHCFIRTNDDCIAIKANRYDDPRGCKDAKRITARDCVLWKDKCGNAVEIGYETSCEEICDILFEDMDVIHCQFEGWQSGGVFTIHNGDRAHVHDITYRNFRIEGAEEKLIDFKILTSKYSVDKWRGKISNIILDGIYVSGEELPPSIIRGYESDLGEPELIKNITIRNLYVNGKAVNNQMQAHMITELADGIVFEIV